MKLATLKKAKNLKANTISGERFVNYDKTNNTYKVRVVIDNNVVTYKAFRDKAKAIAHRDETIKAILKPAKKATVKKAAAKKTTAKATVKATKSVAPAAKSNNKLGERYIYQIGNKFFVEIRKAGQHIKQSFTTLAKAKTFRNKQLKALTA